MHSEKIEKIINYIRTLEPQFLNDEFVFKYEANDLQKILSIEINRYLNLALKDNHPEKVINEMVQDIYKSYNLILINGHDLLKLVKDNQLNEQAFHDLHILEEKINLKIKELEENNQLHKLKEFLQEKSWVFVEGKSDTNKITYYITIPSYYGTIILDTYQEVVTFESRYYDGSTKRSIKFFHYANMLRKIHKILSEN